MLPSGSRPEASRRDPVWHYWSALASMELLVNTSQDAQDWGEISEDLDAGARVDAAYSLSRALAELEAAAFESSAEERFSAWRAV